ncbi:MAG: AsmA family protein [Bacteroidetes bacterium]|nr:AsmA family protein [Bacteroidota bacterium]
MKKFLIGLVIFLSIFFLFGGLFLVGAFTNNTNNISGKYVTAQSESESLSMKQIDSVTSKYNYPFTSINAAGISVYSVGK